jgi:hypothetical protein
MVAPHVHTTDEAKADIKAISHNKGRGDNEGPKGIGGTSTSTVKTTYTKDVEPSPEGSDVVSKRPL